MKEDYYEFEYLMKRRPHVVILGAGASCAAIPNGDKNGKRISTRIRLKYSLNPALL